MRINEIESIVGIPKKNIRFYEEKGLLAPRRNNENGYRDYGEADVTALRQIRLLRKLGLPIEEIRRMQSGALTVGDGMRRHLITLEREQRNLEQAIRLCSALQRQDIPLQELDAAAVLTEIEELEQAGTTFRSDPRQDTRKHYLTPVIISLCVLLFLAGIVALFAWACYIDPENAPPLGLLLFLLAFPVLAAGGILLALYQRIREIKSGESDDAKQY